MSGDWDADWDLGPPKQEGNGKGNGASRGTLVGVCPECGWPRNSCGCDSQLRDSTSESLGRPPGAPTTWLHLAAGLTVIGGLLALVLRETLVWVLLGWALAGPAAVLVYGQFKQKDIRLSTLTGYGRPPWLESATRWFPALVILAVALCSWRMGIWVGHR